MKTKEFARQEISAFADGELKDQEFEAALAALRHDERRDDWEMYHQIGDLLRSNDMNVKLSPSFSARMAARLELEPPILAPSAVTQSSPTPPAEPASQAEANNSNAQKRQSKYWFASGIAAAGVAAAALVGVPQLMVASGKAPASGNSMANVSPDARHASNGSATNSLKIAPQGSANAAGTVLRYPRIDDYLLAHQRSSPSLYGATHYARSAIFATDSDK